MNNNNNNNMSIIITTMTYACVSCEIKLLFK